MKPWEETWEQTEPGNRVINGIDTEVFLHVGPRLDLACAAPEMARALRRYMYDTEDGACVACGVYSTMEHKERCIIASALRKAGVPTDT
jgi:hypothetical protein